MNIMNTEGYITEKKAAGVYKITNLKTDDTYLAFSEDIPKAISESRFALDLGMHECKSLQEDYAKTGLELFVFETVEKTEDQNSLEEIRKEYIAKGISLY